MIPTEITLELEERIENGRKEYAEGKTMTVKTHQQLDEYLDSLEDILPNLPKDL